jgi:hypothetical protein
MIAKPRERENNANWNDENMSKGKRGVNREDQGSVSTEHMDCCAFYLSQKKQKDKKKETRCCISFPVFLTYSRNPRGIKM